MGRKKKIEVIDLKLPKYIDTSDRSTSVIGMIESDNKDDYTDGKGYIGNDNESIWIYSRTKPSKRTINAYPYFWFENGKIMYSSPSKFIRDIYSISSLRDLSIVNIIDKTVPGESLFNEKEILDINAAANFYRPEINKDDDFLKKIVKLVIIEKGVDINSLKSKTELPYMLPNMRSALTNQTKMSVNYFLSWMELLGCTFSITVKDDESINTGGDHLLNNEHTYDASTDKMFVNINGNKVPLDIEQFYSISNEDMTTEED